MCDLKLSNFYLFIICGLALGPGNRTSDVIVLFLSSFSITQLSCLIVELGWGCWVTNILIWWCFNYWTLMTYIRIYWSTIITCKHRRHVSGATKITKSMWNWTFMVTHDHTIINFEKCCWLKTGPRYSVNFQTRTKIFVAWTQFLLAALPCVDYISAFRFNEWRLSTN